MIVIDSPGNNTRYGISVLLALLLFSAAGGVDPARARAQAPALEQGFEISLWAREPLVLNPVALSFDDRGDLYVAETARRGTVDIDIRAHKDWIVQDLANQSVDDLRAFFRRAMAPEKSAENRSWLADRNGDGSHDWRDLREVKETIRRLSDRDGDGAADESVVFAEGFNEEISGVLAGVLPYRERVFATVYPDLWELRDTDGDGVADEQRSLFRGFGVHAAFDGHDLHGLTVGPDGKIYFSVGDNGFSVVTREGRRLHHPNTGGVLRMNPDGSGLEVYARGLRNVQEIAFDKFGNLFSVDNDGDLEDERERFVFIAEGSDSGWRLNWQFRTEGWARFTGAGEYNPWIADALWKPHFAGQAAYITPPLSNYSVGPGGFKANPGTALNEQYRNHFFLVQFPVRKITAFTAESTDPGGASFRMESEHVFHPGMMASAVNFAPDGGLFIADWDGMWMPNERGAIFRLDDPLAARSAIRHEVRDLLSSGTGNLSDSVLTDLLRHADRRVRGRAQSELAARGAVDRFLRIANDPVEPVLARVHALWGLGENPPASRAIPADRLPFRDPHPEIRAQAAKIAGDLRLTSASPALVAGLSDPNGRVRFHSAIALGKAGDVDAIPALVRMARENDDRDPFLRHAAVMGLSGIGSAPELGALSDHESAAVRAVAVVALRRLRSGRIAPFLRDPDPWVAREAARAVHDDFSIPEAMPSLALLLDKGLPDHDEAVARRSINANLRLGRNQDAERLVRFAMRRTGPGALRILALQALTIWDQDPHVDRVEGRVRRLTPEDAGTPRRLLERALPDVFRSADHDLIPAATRAARALRLDLPPDVLASWVRSDAQPVEVRLDALDLLTGSNAPGKMGAIDAALASGHASLRMAGLDALARLDPDRALDFIESNDDVMTLREKQRTFAILSAIGNERADRRIAAALRDLLAGDLPNGLALDALEAGQSRDSPELRMLVASYEASLAPGDVMDRFRTALEGGDPVRGAELYRGHVAAQCVRCHDAGGGAAQVGPDLRGIGARVSAEYLLESLILPGATIADGYALTTLTLEDGAVLAGRVARTTPETIEFIPAGGLKAVRVETSAVRRQYNAPVSVMPPMGGLLTVRELRDLVAHLKTLRD